MERVTLDEVLPLPEYERVRSRIRPLLIELRNLLRLSLGSYISIGFENHETILHQIREMVRAESITDFDAVKQEVETYNSLIPEAKQLSATLFIEISDLDELRRQLGMLIGIEHAVSICLAGGGMVPGKGESGRSTDQRTSTIHYLRFSFSDDQLVQFLDPDQSAEVVINHPNYSVSKLIPSETRLRLIQDIIG